MDIANNRAKWNASGTLQEARLAANCLGESLRKSPTRRAACPIWRTSRLRGVSLLRHSGAMAD